MTAPTDVVPLLDRGIPAGGHRGLYLAGPMTGRPDHGYAVFADAARKLRAQGYDVINPAELHDNNLSRAFDWYLRRDLSLLLTCSALALLPGWERSRGATLERNVAAGLGMPIYLYQFGTGRLEEIA